ncbi:MAG TPA: orotidine 5'-phosphate decarboxylase / HUMPS family protein, partial [Coxiellaceae bacterium]|nr:orotidine 5'-phosphate decarboxylase / HUMPS family protein [Coxiellaceae bacterium]
SSQEAANLREQLDHSFVLVTPGIRLADDEAGDQKRILTPRAALQAGSNYLVIGRPITQARDPLKVLEKIYSEIATH